MKTNAKKKYSAVLLWAIILLYFGLQFSCTQDESFNTIAEVSIQIHLPETDNLKSAAAVTTISMVVIRVTAGDKVLDERELNISGNTASGTISITKGENRTFTVEARDENNIIQWQGSTTLDIIDNFKVDIALTPVRPTVSNLQASVSENSVHLSWTQNRDDDFGRYILYRSKSENETGDTLFSSLVAGETEYWDNYVSEGQHYFYTLRLIDTEGITANSNVVRVDVPVTYLSPVNLVMISNDSNRVILSWSKSNEPDFAGYELKRSPSKDTTGVNIFSTTDATDTTFTDNDVAEGISYFYTCVATDTAGYSTNSNQVQVDMPRIFPSASTLEAAFDGYVYLNWSENHDTDFAFYELHRSEDKDELGQRIFSTQDVSATEFTDKDLRDGVIYYYTLIVFDLDDLSAESKAEVKILIPPTPVTLSYEIERGNYPVLNWTRSTDTDFAGYHLYRSLTDNENWERIFLTGDVTETGFSDETVIAGNTYRYTVVVFDKDELTAASNEVQIEVIGPGSAYLDGFTEGEYAYLYWKESAGPDVLRYDLYRSQSKELWGEIIYSTGPGTNTYFIDQEVREGSTYYYRVVVYNKNGLYTESNLVELVLENLPPPPVKLTGQYQMVDSLWMISLSWSENNNWDFDRYELYRSETSSDIGTRIFTTGKISDTYYEDTAIEHMSTYYYTLVVYDKGGLRANSNRLKILTYILY